MDVGHVPSSLAQEAGAPTIDPIHSRGSHAAIDTPTPATLAQKTLVFITTARLPPTPEVYEVFYRFFEGTNEALTAELSFRVDDPSTVTLELILSLYNQYIRPTGFDGNGQWISSMSEEIAGFSLMLKDQHQAGVEFAGKLGDASEALQIANPVDVIETVGQVRKDTRMMESKIEQMQDRVLKAEQRSQDLKQQLLASQMISMTDHLTGVGNRRFYDSILGQTVREAGRAVRADRIAYLAIVDCDRFKSINDDFGHPIGDQLLKNLAEIMQQISPEASIARLGGDEFAAFLRCDRVDEVEVFANELRHRFSQQKIVHQNTQDELRRLTLSIGIAAIRRDDDGSSWHARADRLLYEAKNLGGDRVVVERSRVS